jgi:transcriptional regulator with XRE-family HTH domain
MILRLKELLKEKGLTGKELAEKVEVSENTISFISTGKTQPRFDLLIKIAEVLDVDIKDLFNSTKEYQTETIYVNRGGKYMPIGELKKDNL